MLDSPVPDGRRARGDASRRAILEWATDLASVQGLDGLTIGALAEASDSSKSSIATLFRSKQGLQLATVAAAREIFTERIIAPARSEPRGARRLAALLRNQMAYSRDRVFTGGCFFAATAADVDSKPGPVSEAVRAALTDWYRYLELQVEAAGKTGELRSDAPDALAFELVSLAEHANARSLLLRSSRPYETARAAMANRLRAAGADAQVIATLDPLPLAPALL